QPAVKDRHPTDEEPHRGRREPDISQKQAPVATGANQKIDPAVSIPCISVVTNRLLVRSYTQTRRTRYAVRLATAAKKDSIRNAVSGMPPAYVPLMKTCCRKCHSPQSTPTMSPV